MSDSRASRALPRTPRSVDHSEASRPLLASAHENSDRMGKQVDAAADRDGDQRWAGSGEAGRDSEDVGAAADAETPYEQKCLLINREIDANGFGRYQWYIWLLCGFGYMLDLLWAQAFGLILGPLEQELGFGDQSSGNISVAFSAGLTAGAFVWGVLVDIIGRRWAFNLTCFFSAAFGISLGGCNTYTAFLVVTAFVGFGIGGNIPIDTTICLEFIPQNKRFMLALLSIFQPVGVVVTCAVAYAFIPNFSCQPNFSEPHALPSCYNVADGVPCCTKADNMGWRYLMFTLGSITLFVFFSRSLLFRFRESPKFLVYKGRDADAIQVLEHIARTNKRTCGVSLEEFQSLDAEHKASHSATTNQDASTWRDSLRKGLARYRQLFDTSLMARLTILVWLTYAFDFWGFTLAGTYLPKILAIKNAEIHLTLRETYRSYIAVYAPGIVGVVAGSMMYRVPHIGRKLAMTFASGLMGASIFIFSTVNSEASNIGLNAMEYFFQSMFNAVLYGWTPEAFAAPVRGTACGIAAFWGRLFSILAPLTAQSIIPSQGLQDPVAINRVLYMAGGLTLGCVITTALLPNKSLGSQSL